MAKSKKYPSEGLSPDYEVGFGKPPKETQFKKGQSGNPRGRPKGSPNLATTLRRALTEKVRVAENGRQRTVTKVEAALTQLVNRAAQGELQYIRTLLTVMNAVESSLASDTGKSAADLTDPAILASLIDQVDRGTHLVIAPPSPESSPANPSTPSDTSTPGDESNPHT